MTPANAAYTAEELTHQLVSSGAKALFTCQSLLQTATPAAANAGVAPEHVYCLEIPGELAASESPRFILSAMIERGRQLPSVKPLKFDRGQGARQTAFLCYSSGTSGQPVRRNIRKSHSGLNTHILAESRYDLTLQRHSQYPPDVRLRVCGQSTRQNQHASTSCTPPLKPYLRTCRRISRGGVEERRIHCVAKVRLPVVPSGHPALYGGTDLGGMSSFI